MKKLTAGWKEYELYSVTGTVRGASKHMETKVHGGGGGGYSYQGTGYSAPVSVTSTTTVHDQLFLEDKEGKEHAFQLADFNVACRDGHQLTVLWAIKKGASKGPYIAVRNHTTSDSFFEDNALRKMFRPHWIYPLLVTALCLWQYKNLPLPLLWPVVAYVAWWIMGVRGAKKFKAEINFDELNSPAYA